MIFEAGFQNHHYANDGKKKWFLKVVLKPPNEIDFRMLKMIASLKIIFEFLKNHLEVVKNVFWHDF